MRRLWLFGAAVSAWMVGVAIADPPAAKKSAPGAAETGSREPHAKPNPTPNNAAPKRAAIEILPAPAVVPKPPAPSTGAPGMDGSWALGHVMPTPSHPDAQPWPNGMLIEPKDIGDANVIVPGTRRLPGHPGPQSWSEAFSRGIRLGLDSVLQPLTPPIGTWALRAGFGAPDAIGLTADFVRRFGELGEAMRIYTDGAAFDEELRIATQR